MNVDWKPVYEAWKKYKFTCMKYFLQLNNQFKKDILERDNNQCIACHTTSNLRLAHLVPLPRSHLEFYIQGGREWEIQAVLDSIVETYYSPYNLLILCEKCHRAFHSRGGDKTKLVKKKVREYLKQLFGKDYKEILINNLVGKEGAFGKTTKKPAEKMIKKAIWAGSANIE